MDFKEAMLFVSENEGAAVIRPDARMFIWYDQQPWMKGGPPLGLNAESVDSGKPSTFYRPSIDDIVATDWEVYVPVQKPSL